MGRIASVPPLPAPAGLVCVCVYVCLSLVGDDQANEDESYIVGTRRQAETYARLEHDLTRSRSGNYTQV